MAETLAGRTCAARAFNARIDQLFAVLSPSEDEYAAILRHARRIGELIERHLG